MDTDHMSVLIYSYIVIVWPHNTLCLVAGPGFAPGMVQAYETRLLATLPAIVWSGLEESNLFHVLFRHLL